MSDVGLQEMAIGPSRSLLTDCAKCLRVCWGQKGDLCPSCFSEAHGRVPIAGGKTAPQPGTKKGK
jgi:hypothetical protein